MKRSKLKTIISMMLLIVASCDEPETTVTDIVHTDGSVTRRIEMKSIKNEFRASDIQVPFDSTWIVRDSMEIDSGGDTIWVKRAEKLFVNADAINRDYMSDSCANKEIRRHVLFSKKFRWFNTKYRFSEVVDKKLDSDHYLSDFLNKEELRWFYSPASVTGRMKTGPDSLKYKAFSDTVDRKVVRWTYKCLLSEIISEFTALTSGREGADEVADSLKSHEDHILKILEKNDDKVDSLLSDELLLKRFTGSPDAPIFESEADSAINLAVEKVAFDFKEYAVRIIMPGSLTATNGFTDSAGVVLWPVRSDFFLTEKYEMYAESQVSNKWAWIITAVFVVFVLTGIILHKRGKG